jgi:hypothetical protein
MLDGKHRKTGRAVERGMLLRKLPTANHVNETGEGPNGCCCMCAIWVCNKYVGNMLAAYIIYYRYLYLGTRESPYITRRRSCPNRRPLGQSSHALVGAECSPTPGLAHLETFQRSNCMARLPSACREGERGDMARSRRSVGLSHVRVLTVARLHSLAPDAARTLLPHLTLDGLSTAPSSLEARCTVDRFVLIYSKCLTLTSPRGSDDEWHSNS